MVSSVDHPTEDWFIMHEKLEHSMDNVNKLKWIIGTHGKWKKNQNWQLQNGPTILIFSIAMGADYSFELIYIVHWVLQFIGHNKIFQGSVGSKSPTIWSPLWRTPSRQLCIFMG
jgi:hypothetical protein